MAKTNEYYREYYQKNREKILARERAKYNEKYKEKKKEYDRKRLAKLKETAPERYKRRSIKQRYGITCEQYWEMVKHQENKCAICGIHRDSLLKDLSIDHCHTTGKVRGLLCGNCNLGLGYFKDDETLMDKAKYYLKKTK